MTKEIFFEDLPVGIVVNIKIHRQSEYERVKLERIVLKTETLTNQEVYDYYGEGRAHNILNSAQRKIDPSSFKYQDTINKRTIEFSSSALTRYIFRKVYNEKKYLIIPITPTTVETTKISLPDLNLF